jgi:hypothetical protein
MKERRARKTDEGGMQRRKQNQMIKMYRNNSLCLIRGIELFPWGSVFMSSCYPFYPDSSHLPDSASLGRLNLCSLQLPKPSSPTSTACLHSTISFFSRLSSSLQDILCPILTLCAAWSSPCHNQSVPITASQNYNQPMYWLVASLLHSSFIYGRSQLQSVHSSQAPTQS